MKASDPCPLGFGLERIGLFAIRHARIVVLLVLASLAAVAASLPQLRFDGDFERLLTSERPHARDYRAMIANYPDLRSGLVLRIRPAEGRLLSPGGLARLADFHLDLALGEGIETVHPPFALRWLDGGALRRVLPLGATAAELDATVAAALAATPALAAAISPKADAVRSHVILAPETGRSNARLSEAIARIRALADDYGLVLALAGPPAMQAELVGLLISDQILITLMGILCGAAIAAVVLGDWRGVVLCSGVTTIAMVWTLGAMIVLRQPLDMMTTILPILAGVLAFADAVHLVADMRRAPRDMPLGEMLAASVRTIGPATALTSITTAMAFATLAVGGTALHNLAVFGALTAGVALFAVLLALPAMAHVLFTHVGPQPALATRAGAWIPPLANAAISHPRAVGGAAIVAVAALMVVHIVYPPAFSAYENIAPDAQSRLASDAIDRDFGGSGRIVVLVPLQAGESYDSPTARARLIAAEDAVARHVGAAATASAATLWRELSADGPVPPDMLAQISRANGLVARDGRSMPVAAQVSASTSAADLRALHARLGAEPALEGATITGLVMMSAFEATGIIQNLKLGLLLAVVMTAALIALRLGRSPGVFAAVTVSNLAIVLVVQGIAWATGQPGEFALYIALTIALGIGSDDAVHILNLYGRARAGGQARPLAAGIARAAPALAISSFVLAANVLVTLVSDLRPVWFVGGVVSVTILVALLCNVIVLPAILALTGRREG